MDINLSWDLFIIVLFVVIVAYGLMMGKDGTLKVILGTYISAFCADAIGNFYDGYLLNYDLFMKPFLFLGIHSPSDAIIFIKIICFLILIILFAVRGAFEIRTSDDSSSTVRLVINILYSVASAGLIIVSILTFVSGIRFLGGGNPHTLSTALLWVNSQSGFIRIIVDYSYLLFALPALMFLVHSLHSKRLNV